ncbi:hypothetical protein [Streptomyces sp. NPDC006285]|uniref:hypothetical protein n=1 Tax=Streptomyces sp. NPDC006285 TaxID=3364742 RepID=UPI00367DFE00
MERFALLPPLLLVLVPLRAAFAGALPRLAVLSAPAAVSEGAAPVCGVRAFAVRAFAVPALSVPVLAVPVLAVRAGVIGHLNSISSSISP